MEKSRVVTILGVLNLVVLMGLTGLVGKSVLKPDPVEVAGPVEAAPVELVPQTYEFLVTSIPDLEWGIKAQELGQEGWALVSARRASGGDDKYLYECIFQRQSR